MLTTFRFGIQRYDADPYTCGIVGIKQGPHIFTARTAPERFNNGLRECLSSIRTALDGHPSNSILVYLHGFYNNFEHAAKHGLEFSASVGFQGVVLVWSWPSDGSAKAYLADGETAQRSERPVGDFISALIRSLADTKFHLLAHSMGTRILLSVMGRLAQDNLSQRVDSVVLAAGDLDQAFFAQEFRALLGLPGAAMHPTVTNYTSDRDLALMTSRILRSANQPVPPRMGTAGSDIFVGQDLDVQSIESSALRERLIWMSRKISRVSPQPAKSPKKSGQTSGRTRG